MPAGKKRVPTLDFHCRRRCETNPTQRLHDLGHSVASVFVNHCDVAAAAFVKSWNDLMAVIASKSAALGRAA